MLSVLVEKVGEHLTGGGLEGLEEGLMFSTHASCSLHTGCERLIPGDVNHGVNGINIDQPGALREVSRIDAVGSERIENVMSGPL